MKKSLTSSPEIAALLMLLDEAFNKPAWHGPNFRGALRRVDATQAAWRPTPNRKNVWEITLQKTLHNRDFSPAEVGTDNPRGNRGRGVESPLHG